MKSQVYFVKVEDAGDLGAVNSELSLLLSKSKVLGFLQGMKKAVVKLHFGEEGTNSYVNPDHLRVICNEIARKETESFLSDANTLYRGKRLNSKDHLKVAMAHGFTKQATGVDIFIPDDANKADITEVQIDQKYIKTAKGRTLLY